MDFIDKILPNKVAEDIIISQFDTGIAIDLFLLNDEGNNIDLTQEEVHIHVLRPDGKCIDIPDVAFEINDTEHGIVRLFLYAELTELEGNHAIYVELKSGIVSVSAIEAIYYFVLKRHNGGDE